MIVVETAFNEKGLNGETAKTFSIGSSVDGTNNNTIATNDAMTAAIEDFTTAADAEASADLILIDVAVGLGNIAASISSLKARQSVSYASAANLEAAASRVLDTDYARETANLTKASVLNQSAMAMVAQANQAQSSILAVLQ
jgi:flagellin